MKCELKKNDAIGWAVKTQRRIFLPLNESDFRISESLVSDSSL